MKKKLWRPIMPKTLSWRIKYYRERDWWSINELAIEAWIPRITYFKIENNPDANPSIFNVVRIARALGVKVDDLTRHSFKKKDENATEE